MQERYNNEVSIQVGDVKLIGNLVIPLHAEAIVIFSHGSGSSRMSSRNQKVAGQLRENNFGTLLFDLLTELEDTDFYNRFDIKLLTNRLVGATEWLEKQPAANNCALSYFGASTGAASALSAAARLPQISSVVSRGGRPDLAMDILHQAKAPVLLIVGSEDHDVLKLNKIALNQLQSKKKLEVVSGATHLFEEKGTMEIVAELASSWFENHLQKIRI